MAININIPKPPYTTAEIPDSVNLRYVTDAELTVIQNTSGTNTGDQDLSGLVLSTRNLTIDGVTQDLSADRIFTSDIIFTIELLDALTVDFYAPYNLKINTVTDILNTPTTTILDDGVSYTLTNTIAVGSEITVTVDTAAVVNLNIVKA